MQHLQAKLTDVFVTISYITYIYIYIFHILFTNYTWNRVHFSSDNSLKALHFMLSLCTGNVPFVNHYSV